MGWVFTSPLPPFPHPSTPPKVALSSLYSWPGQSGWLFSFSCGAPHSQSQDSVSQEGSSPSPPWCSRALECAAPFAELSEPEHPVQGQAGAKVPCLVLGSFDP